MFKKFLPQLALSFLLVASFPAQALITLNEDIDESLTNLTGPMRITDLGGSLGSPFRVEKNILNTSTTFLQWTALHIDLIACGTGNSPGECGRSIDTDGVSFDQDTSVPDWINKLVVKVNGVVQTGWEATRTDVRFDELDLTFNTFVINPGDTLTFAFDMIDKGFELQGEVANWWKLDQTVIAVPEPQTYALLAVGLLMLGGVIGRRSL